MKSLVESILGTNNAGLNGAIEDAVKNNIFDKGLLDKLKNSIAIWKPEDSTELKEVTVLCTKIDPKCSLNWIDVSDITDMYNMFGDSVFNGDISKWNTSKVTDMSYMFIRSLFNGDISKWNTSKVTDIRRMFEYSQFDGDISKWDVSNVTNMRGMFKGSDFNQDISKWDVSKVTDMSWMFKDSIFNGDISKWKIKYNCYTAETFNNCPIKEEYKPKKF